MNEALETKLVAAGIDRNKIGELVRGHGDEVVTMIADLLEKGMSVALIMEALNLGGKMLLELFSSLQAFHLFSASPLAQATDVTEMQATAFQDTVVDMLLSKMLPMIIEKLKTQIDLFLTPENIIALVKKLLSRTN